MNWKTIKGLSVFFEMFIFARALIVCKRVVIEERLERLIEAVLFMLNNKAKVKLLFAAAFPKIKMTNVLWI